MPLVRISMRKGKSAEYKQAILESLYQAMREAFTVPENDRFMIIHEHESENFLYDQNYLSIERTDDLLIIQITANNTRTIDQKKNLYKLINKLLVEKVNIRPEDIFINIVEVPKENWSFGCGVAQYA